MIIPVKDLEHSKSRLSSCLSPEERRHLTLVMFKDILYSAIESNLDEIVAISSDQTVLETAKYLGVKTLEEKVQQGINYAIQRSIDYCINNGAGSILIHPADMPLVKSSDLNQIINSNKSPGVVMVPSDRLDGTNILMLDPPDIIPVKYGRNSPTLHVSEALNRGIYPRLPKIPNFSLDIDAPQDLLSLFERDLNTYTREFLMEKEIHTKISRSI